MSAVALMIGSQGPLTSWNEVDSSCEGRSLYREYPSATAPPHLAVALDAPSTAGRLCRDCVEPAWNLDHAI